MPIFLSSKSERAVSGEARSAVGSSGWRASGRAMPMRSVAPLVMASVMPVPVRNPPVTSSGTVVTVRTRSAKSRKNASRRRVLSEVPPSLMAGDS